MQANKKSGGSSCLACFAPKCEDDSDSDLFGKLSLVDIDSNIDFTATARTSLDQEYAFWEEVSFSHWSFLTDNATNFVSVNQLNLYAGSQAC